MQRQTYQIDKPGNINRLRITESLIPTPMSEEVLVEVKSIGLNFADIFAIKGLYSATPTEPFVPGLEYSGIVLATGELARKYKVGDKVMGVTRFGAYATHLTIDQHYLCPLPENWSFAEGAAFLVQGLTAYYGLFALAQLKKNETVLIHSAAGGVGLLANRMAQKVGAYTIGTVGNKDKIPLLEKEGFQDWIVRGNDFKTQLDRVLKDRPLDVVMECIGGKVMKFGYDRLAPMGRLINYGSAHYGEATQKPNYLRLGWLYLTRPKIDPQKMIESNKAILGFNLIWLYHKKKLYAEMIRRLFDMNLAPPFIGHQYAFTELPYAIKTFQEGNTTGKIIIEV